MNAPRIISRRTALKILAGGALGGGGALADAVFIEPERLSVTRRDIFCKSLPPALDGLRVGLLADFHFRPGHDEELLAKTVGTANAERLDLIALGGDYINHDPAVIHPLADALQNLTARHGIFAVLGNHDGWGGNPARIRRRFEQAGVTFLINENTRLDLRGESLAIAGTDHVWHGHPDPVQTFRGISQDRPVIALVHEPDYFDTVAGYRPGILQLSGHTHGGQCRVPLIGYAPVRVKYGRKYLYGDFSRGDSKLFVTRGIGTTGLRVRFGCPPELAVLTLRSAG